MTPKEIITEALYNIYGSSTVEESVATKAKGLLTRIHKEVQRKAPWWFLFDTLNITTQKGDIKMWRIDGICELPSRPYSFCVGRDRTVVSCNSVYYENGVVYDRPDIGVIIDNDSMSIIGEAPGGHLLTRDPSTGMVYALYLGGDSTISSAEGVYIRSFIPQLEITNGTNTYTMGLTDIWKMSVYGGKIYYCVRHQDVEYLYNSTGKILYTTNEWVEGICAVPEGVLINKYLVSDEGTVVEMPLDMSRPIYDGEYTYEINESIRDEEEGVWYGGEGLTIVKYDYLTGGIVSSVSINTPKEGWYFFSRFIAGGETHQLDKSGVCDDFIFTAVHDEVNDKYYALRISSRSIGIIRKIYSDVHQINRVQTAPSVEGDIPKFYMDREYSSGKRVLSFFPETRSIANCECIVYRKIEFDSEDAVCSNLEDYLIKKLTAEISLVTEYADRYAAYSQAADAALANALAHGTDFDAQEITPGYADA